MGKKAASLLLILLMLMSASALAEEHPDVTEKPKGGLVKFDNVLPFAGKNPKYALPIDFTPGYEPLSTGYGWSDMSYEDPTIRVNITTQEADVGTVWIADIQIADASQLRTAAAESYDAETELPGSLIANRMKAVVAMDGDFYCHTGWGYIIRQGEVYLEKLYKNGSRDVLMIDEDGDFHVAIHAKMEDVGEYINGKKIINSFFFGPALVVDGQLTNDFDYPDMMASERAQRMCLAQVGELHYQIICCSWGMKLEQFAKYVRSLGVQTAYNFDGGYSTMLYWKGAKLNDPDNPNHRNLVDIIYFASAWPGSDE